MVLIPPESVQIGASISSKVSQTSVSTFIDTQVLQVFRCQLWQDLAMNLVLAKRGLRA